MNNPGGQNPLPFDPDSLEKVLGKSMASLLPDLSLINSRDSSWIGDYVQQLLNPKPGQKKTTSSTRTNESLDSIDYNVFETHKSVIARITVPKSVNANLIRIWVQPTNLRIDGLDSDTTQKHTIDLPSLVVAKQSSAVYKDGVLEVRMTKDRNERSSREIFVHFD